MDRQLPISHTLVPGSVTWPTERTLAEITSHPLGLLQYRHTHTYTHTHLYLYLHELAPLHDTGHVVSFSKEAKPDKMTLLETPLDGEQPVKAILSDPAPTGERNIHPPMGSPRHSEWDTHTHTLSHTQTHTHTLTHTHSHTHKHTHSHTHKLTHIHTHTYACLTTMHAATHSVGMLCRLQCCSIASCAHVRDNAVQLLAGLSGKPCIMIIIVINSIFVSAAQRHLTRILYISSVRPFNFKLLLLKNC